MKPFTRTSQTIIHIGHIAFVKDAVLFPDEVNDIATIRTHTCAQETHRRKKQKKLRSPPPNNLNKLVLTNNDNQPRVILPVHIGRPSNETHISGDGKSLEICVTCSCSESGGRTICPAVSSVSTRTCRGAPPTKKKEFSLPFPTQAFHWSSGHRCRPIRKNRKPIITPIE